jgi:hypothetical protein
MGDRISTALALIDDRLDALRALMTDEPVEVVTERYRAWKSATSAILRDVVVASAVRRFDLAAGVVDPADGHRPTPPVYLDGAASRACLKALKKDLEKEAGAALRPPLSRVLDLLERRLPGAFRGRPETELDVHNGFETLLAGAEIAYQRESSSIVHGSRTYVPDFTFPDLQTALELKLCDRPGREKEILAEITDEIAAYGTKYARMVFGIYDLGFIKDPDPFSERLGAPDRIWVRVMRG